MMIPFSRAIRPALLATGIGLAVLPSSASAVLQISFNVQGGPFNVTQTIVDNGAGDIDPTVGTIQLGTIQPIPGLTVTGSTHTAVLGTGSINILSSGSSQIINESGFTVTGTVAVGATDFTPPVTQAFISGSGTFQTAAPGSSIQLRWWDDPTNQQGADTPTDTPGNLLGTFLFTPTTPADSFATNFPAIAVSDLALFSMTEQFIFTLIDGGSLVSRGQTEIKPHALPEPGALGLLGIVLGAIGLTSRRRPG